MNQTDKIRKFKEIIPNLPKPYVFALDKCNFCLNEAPRYGYPLKGSRAVSQRSY